MEQVNSWIKGIDVDTSYKKVSNDTYISLQGGQVITLKGQSSGSIETEKGLLNVFTLPRSPKVYKFKFILEIFKELDAPENASIEFTLGGISGSINNLITVNNNFDFYNLFISNPVIANAISAGTIRVDYSEEFNNITLWGGGVLIFNITNDVNYIKIKEIAAQLNLTIIGSGLFGNDFIIATTNPSSEVSNGQIWRFNIDPQTLQVTTKNGLLPLGAELDIFEHLVYTEELNFSLEHYITRIISNIETPTIGKIYLTDKNNPLRNLNLLADYPLNTPLELTTANASNYFGEIIIEDVLANGFIEVGSAVQYYYRLRSSSGGTTTPVSVGTQMFYLGNTIATTPDTDAEYHGAELNQADLEPDNNLYKSLKLNIKNLDTNYEFLELYFVFYESLDISNVYKVAELPIPDSGSISYIHDGNPENFENVNPQLLNERVFNISSANDIAVKDNRLIAAGVTTLNTKLDFDTRAYRFNNSGLGILKDINLGDITLNAALNLEDQFNNIPEKHDCINPYNDESLNDWYDNQQYKYQANSSTLGGQGKNISYEFTTYRLIGEVDLTANYNGGPIRRTERYSDSDVLDFGDGRIYNLGGEYKSFRSPKIDSYLKGYAREEIYRFCFQAFDLKGNPYYASWIADIKMPAEWDFSIKLVENSGQPGEINNFNNQIGVTFAVGRKRGNKMELYSLGLQFTIKNLDTIADKVSGFTIGTVDRKQTDKTKLLHGIHLPTVPIQNSGGNQFNFVEPLRVTSDAYAFGYNGTNNTSLSGTDKPNITTFRSIDEMLKVDTLRWASGDYIKPNSIYDVDTKYISNGGIFNVRMNASDKINNAKYKRKIPLLDSIYVKYGDRVPTTNYNSLETDVNDSWVMRSNYSDPFEPMHQYDVSGVIVPSNPTGSIEGLWRYSRARTLISPDNDIDRLSWDGYDTSTGTTIPNDPNNNPLIVTASYKRNLNTQYGGNTYEDRQNNIYQSVIPFIKINENVSTIETKVFGGDTYVTYYPMLLVRKDRDDLDFNAVGYNNCNFGISCPLESTINPYMYHGLSWFLNEVTSSEFGVNTSVYTYNENLDHLYNTIYSQKPTFKYLVPKPSLTRDNNYLPAGIFISDLKINGDRADAWLNFRLDNYKEVDNIYGPINTIINFKDRLFYFQDRGLGIQPINERGVVYNDDTGQQLSLGNGELLGKHGYISTRSGSIHTLSVIETDYGLYYYDARANKIKKFDTQSNIPISDVANIFSLLNDKLIYTNISESDLPLLNNGVCAYADFINKRVFFNFLTDEPFSVCYNENMQAVEHFPYYIPKLGIIGDKNLLMEDPNSRGKVYIHNAGEYNTYFNNEKKPLVLKFIIAQPERLIKVLNNLFWTSDTYDKTDGSYIFNQGINRIRVYNKYQDTGYRTDIRQVLQQWAHKVNFNQNSSKKNDRMRSDWHIVEMIFDNTNQNRLILNNVFSNMSISHSGLDKY